MFSGCSDYQKQPGYKHWCQKLGFGLANSATQSDDSLLFHMYEKANDKISKYADGSIKKKRSSDKQDSNFSHI